MQLCFLVNNHLQLQEQPPALLPSVDAFKKLLVVLIMLLQALDLSIVQSQNFFVKVL